MAFICYYFFYSERCDERVHFTMFFFFLEFIFRVVDVLPSFHIILIPPKIGDWTEMIPFRILNFYLNNCVKFAKPNSLNVHNLCDFPRRWLPHTSLNEIRRHQISKLIVENTKFSNKNILREITLYDPMSERLSSSQRPQQFYYKEAGQGDSVVLYLKNPND